MIAARLKGCLACSAAATSTSPMHPLVPQATRGRGWTVGNAPLTGGC